MYVALYYGAGNYLGRTILCETWTEAIMACCYLAIEAGQNLTEQQVDDFQVSEGDYVFDDGSAIHIRQLEEEI